MYIFAAETRVYSIHLALLAVSLWTECKLKICVYSLML